MAVDSETIASVTRRRTSTQKSGPGAAGSQSPSKAVPTMESPIDPAAPPTTATSSPQSAAEALRRFEGATPSCSNFASPSDETVMAKPSRASNEASAARDTSDGVREPVSSQATSREGRRETPNNPNRLNLMLHLVSNGS